MGEAAGAPLPTGVFIAKWTDDEWLVLAVEDLRLIPAPFASFDPESRTWRVLAEAPFSSLYLGVDGVWTGGQLVFLLGHEDGLSYDPATDRWGPIPRPACPAGTESAVWTGEVFIGMYFLFDPSTGECWQLPPAPTRDGWASKSPWGGAVAWTGTELLVWGGSTGGDIDVAPADGAAFSPH